MAAERAAPAMTLSAHAVQGFFRDRAGAFFTLIFPLLFLVIVAAAIGDERTPEGVPIVQFLIAPFGVFGIAQGAFTVLAIDTAVLREGGMFLRLRGTPAPRWAVLTSRVVAALVASLTSFLLVTLVGVAAYGVEMQWRKVPALLITLVLGSACLASLGLALTSLTRTVLAARTAAQGILIPLAFISDVFIVGADLPRALSVIGSALPLKHFADAAADTFQPGGGTGYSPAHLAVLAAWTVVGASVAWWRFGWAPRGFATGHAQPAEDNTPVNRHGLTPATEPGRPATVALLHSQTAYALRSLYRDPLATFFSVIFPAVILILFPSVFGDATVRGLSMAQYLLPAMAGYAIAVAAYVTLPESVADARAQGVLRRLRGTPLPFRWYLAGRILSAIAVGLISCTLLVLVAVLGLGVRFAPAALPAFLLAVLLGAGCFAGLGLAVVALLPAARSVVPVTLGTLLPLSFVSGTFIVGAAPLPSWLDRIGEFFPLRHLTEALLAATRPDTTEFAWPHLALVALWTVAAFGLAWLRRDALTGSAADSLPRRRKPSESTTSQDAR